MERPIDTLKGLLKSKSILLFTALQIVLAMAQPYLAKTGIDPILADAAIDIAAVIALRLITKASLAEKGSGLEKIKTGLGSIESLLANPFYRSSILTIMKQQGIDPSELRIDLSKTALKGEYADAKIYKIGGDKFRKLKDGSFVPVQIE